MNYSYEDLRRDLKISEHVIFSYKNNFCHLHSDLSLWHLSDSEKDLQTFHALDELMEQATLEGVPLKEKWSEVKIV